jgi:hypothetical protein
MQRSCVGPVRRRGQGGGAMSNFTRGRLEKERERVFEALERAARMVGQRDAYILENDLREEAIIHRLAYYLEDILLKDTILKLEGCAVDCEYNSGSGYLRKRLQIPWPKGSQSQLRKRDQRVRPDIIVHQRGGDGEHLNLLMVEVKKSSTISPIAHKYAILKCEAYRESSLNYLFAGFVCFLTGQSLKSHPDPWKELRKFPKH